MTDDPGRARPVSGELMVDDTTGAPAVRHDDVVDAEFETVGAPMAPQDEAAASIVAVASAPLSGMTSLNGHAGPVPSGDKRAGPLFWTAGIAVVAAAFWVSGGHALVPSGAFDAVPGSALRLSDIKSRVDVSGARALLFVDGEAANDGATAEMLPPIVIAVTGNDGAVTRYRLGTSGKPLAAGEKFSFSSRLDVPKNGVLTVSVTFGE